MGVCRRRGGRGQQGGGGGEGGGKERGKGRRALSCCMGAKGVNIYGTSYFVPGTREATHEGSSNNQGEAVRTLEGSNLEARIITHGNPSK